MVTYDKKSLIGGLMVGTLLATTVISGRNMLEERFPAKMAHYFGNERVECVDNHASSIDLSDLTRGDILAQSIMTTPDTSKPFVGGFFYLQPKDTTSIKNGYPIFVEHQAHSTICQTVNSNGIIKAFAGDEGEGGYVTRIDMGLPPAEAIGKYFEGNLTPEILEYKSLLDGDKIPDDQNERVKRISKLYEFSAVRLRNLDIDYVLGPPLDIVLDTESDDNIMSKHDRAYSSNPDTVISLASLYIDAMHSEGIRVIGKHYLGVGLSSIDPHKAGTAITIQNRTELEKPFVQLAKKLDGIMVSHLATENPLIPDSLNPEVYRHLREDLSFEGLLITDDLYMGAVEEYYGANDRWIETASRDALVAGADVVILKYSEDVGDILSGLSREIIRNSRLETSVEASFARIMTFKGIEFTDGRNKHPNVNLSTDRTLESLRPLNPSQNNQWLRRRVKLGDSLISIIAAEDPTIATYNHNGDLAIVDNNRWELMVDEFERQNHIRPTQMQAGKVYLFPDLNGDAIIAPTTSPTPSGQTATKQTVSETFPLKVNRGDTFYGFLAAELGCQSIVDGRTGRMLPITKGPLQPYHQAFIDANDGVDPRKIKAGKTYKFPDANGNGVVEILDEGDCFR